MRAPTTSVLTPHSWPTLLHGLLSHADVLPDLAVRPARIPPPLNHPGLKHPELGTHRLNELPAIRTRLRQPPTQCTHGTTDHPVDLLIGPFPRRRTTLNLPLLNNRGL